MGNSGFRIFSLAGALTLFLAGTLPAATLTVTNLFDSGPGTLRNTIAAAAPGDTINFAVRGAILLTNGKMVIDKNLEVAGPGAGQLVINGQAASPIFEVTNAVVSISDLTISNGFSSEFAGSFEHPAGGGVRNFGTLTMERCVVTRCDAEQGEGGGIFSAGWLTLRQCTIDHNYAEVGGGIGDIGAGQLKLEGCCVSYNAVSGPGGGGGGGIGKQSGLLWLTNCTISGNGGGDGVGGISANEAVMQSCTVVSNFSMYSSAGVAGAIQCGNSIIAENVSVEGLNGFWDVGGTLQSGGYNLIQHTNDCVITGDTTSNIYGRDPLLGRLQNNGGPTPTHALLGGSPAIDQGSSGGLLSDERGLARIFDVTGVTNAADGCDIGAYEYGADVFIPIEAESGTLGGAMTIGSDGLASQGKYVYCPPTGSGIVTFNIDIPVSTTYLIWCRVLSPNISSDSFYVSVDGGPELVYDTAENIQSPLWQWTRVIGRATNGPIDLSPRIFNLSQGTHTLLFRARDPNTKLDALLITSNPSFVPALELEAESGTLTSPMVSGSDPVASMGAYVFTGTANQGQDTLSVRIAAEGTYYVWCRVLATNFNADSLVVSMDGGPALIYDVAEGSWSTAWQWSRLIGRTNGAPVDSTPRTFYLTQTNHSLVFAGREANCKLDKLVFTTDPNYVPTGPGITNSWISAVSGNWHDLSWSLGRPDIVQTAVVVTNDGQKTVTLNSVTVNSYPGTMVISNLLVAGTPSSTNTVQLNNTGTTTPFQIFNSCTVASNGVLGNVNGLIKLQGAGAQLIISGGSVNQSGGSNVFTGQSWVGYGTNYGCYNLTNGSTVMESVQIGGAKGGLYNQLGGSTIVSNYLDLAGATFNLAAGTLFADSVIVGITSPSGNYANFFQGSGAASSANRFSVGVAGGGKCYLTNGAFWTGETEVGAGSIGYFYQLGGTHQTDCLKVSDVFGTHGAYVLSEGHLSSKSTEIYGPYGEMRQSGGTNCSESLLVQSIGTMEYGAGYQLGGGVLASSTSTISGSLFGGALFAQTNGMHLVSNQLAITGVDSGFGKGQYIFTGGKLSACNITASPFGALTVTAGAVTCQNLTMEAYPGAGAVEINVSGGCSYCTNLSIGASRIFNLWSGSLTCSTLTLGTATPGAAPGVFHHTGGALTNTGNVIFNAGSLSVDNVTEQLGSIILNETSTDVLGTNHSVQHFAASAGNGWNPDAVLSIVGWNGSTNGGGLHQIYVGNSASGLSLSQLSQIRFLPVPGGMNAPYARILSTGEIVPSAMPPIPSLCESIVSNKFVLSWQAQDTNGWVCQTATNVSGPWVEMIGGSPIMISPVEFQRYFRLAGGTPWASQDVGLVSPNGSAFALDGVWTVSGDGADIWDEADAFQFVSKSWSGDGSISARVLSCEETDPWAKAGVMMRGSLDLAAANYATVVTASSGTQAQWRNSSGAGSTNFWANGSAAPYWVKVARRGNFLEGCVSPDGVNWTLLKAQAISLTDPICAGLGVTSHAYEVLNTATFDNVNLSSDPAPLPWMPTDVGAVYDRGTTSWSNGVFTVKSYGYDAWSTSDQFHCIYQTISGDASLTVHIASLQNGDSWAKAGVMFRNDLSTGAAYSGTMMTPGHGTVLQRRYQANEGTTQIAGPNLHPPCWLGVIRRGSVFYNYVSSDGTSWTLIGNSDVVNMGTAYACVFVTTHSLTPTVSETAVFDFVGVSQP